MPLPGVRSEEFPEIAERLGITVPHVWDLSSHDDEVASTLSIRQAHRLSLITGVGLDALIGFETGDPPEPVSTGDFCTAIRTHISKHYSGILDFEEAVGWSVEEVLADSERLYDVANWDCLRDLASSVGIDPVAVLPLETTKRTKRSTTTA